MRCAAGHPLLGQIPPRPAPAPQHSDSRETRIRAEPRDRHQERTAGPSRGGLTASPVRLEAASPCPHHQPIRRDSRRRNGTAARYACCAAPARAAGATGDLADLARAARGPPKIWCGRWPGAAGLSTRARPAGVRGRTCRCVTHLPIPAVRAAAAAPQPVRDAGGPANSKGSAGMARATGSTDTPSTPSLPPCGPHRLLFDSHSGHQLWLVRSPARSVRSSAGSCTRPDSVMASRGGGLQAKPVISLIGEGLTACMGLQLNHGDGWRAGPADTLSEFKHWLF